MTSGGSGRLHVIVFANEKGGTGKSTTAVHTAIALAAKGAAVSALDLDHRQRTLGRYLDNRLATIKRTGRDLPMPRYATHDGESMEVFNRHLEELAKGADYLVIDTPGRDDQFARIAVTNADTLMLVAKPSGYITSTGDAHSTSTPASVSIRASVCSRRG